MENPIWVGSISLKTRSDVGVRFRHEKTGGIRIHIKSKVNALFGDQIKTLAEEILAFFEINHASLEIVDFGAVNFVIAARIEAAIKKVVNTKKEFLLPLLPENKQPTERDAFRISRLYLPGNSPKLMLNAGIHNPNGLILDLEDAVAYDKKDEARYLVRNALRSLHFYGSERMVRINQGERGLQDLDFVIPHFVNLILIPKCESAEQIKLVDDKIAVLKKKYNIENNIWLMPIIESAKGVINAYDIATSTKNIVSMAIGLEDYTADIGTQ